MQHNKSQMRLMTKQKKNRFNVKNQNNCLRNIEDFFVEFSDAILVMDVDVKIAHKNWIFSKLDIMQIR